MIDLDSLVEAEATVLAAAIKDADVRAVVLAAMDPEWFVSVENRQVFTSIQKLELNGTPVDRMAVLRQARSDSGRASIGDSVVSADWVFRAVALSSGVTLDAIQRSHLPALREGYRIRSLEALSMTLGDRVSRARHSDDVLLWLHGQIVKIERDMRQSEIVTEAKLLSRLRPDREISQAWIGPRSRTKELDDLNVRFAPKKCTVIAARPKQGKSTMARQVAIGTSYDTGVVVFNLEMGQQGWVESRVTMLTEDSFDRYITEQSAAASYEIMADYIERSHDRPLYIIDASPALSALDVIAEMRRLKREDPRVTHAIIDQMQQIVGWDDTRKGEGRDQQPTRIIKELVRGTYALDMHLTMVHQLSRNAAGREPKMSDLAETSYFERVADQIIFLWRQSVERPETLDFEGNEIPIDPKTDRVLVKLAARRGGPPGASWASWYAPKTQIGAFSDTDATDAIMTAQRKHEPDIAEQLGL